MYVFLYSLILSYLYSFYALVFLINLIYKNKLYARILLRQLFTYLGYKKRIVKTGEKYNFQIPGYFCSAFFGVNYALILIYP